MKSLVWFFFFAGTCAIRHFFVNADGGLPFLLQLKNARRIEPGLVIPEILRFRRCCGGATHIVKSSERVRRLAEFLEALAFLVERLIAPGERPARLLSKLIEHLRRLCKILRVLVAQQEQVVPLAAERGEHQLSAGFRAEDVVVQNDRLLLAAKPAFQDRLLLSCVGFERAVELGDFFKKFQRLGPCSPCSWCSSPSGRQGRSRSRRKASRGFRARSTRIESARRRNPADDNTPARVSS